jgi:iron complex transport system substrate-binding protein
MYIIAVVVIAIIAVASVSAVMLYQGSGEAETTPSPSPTATATPTPTESPTVSPSPTPLSVELTDDTGYTFTISEYPERLVSLAPGNTQILFAVGAGDNVVGVTAYCNYPYNFSAWIEAGNMSLSGNYYEPTVEPIIALNPDMVFAALGSADVAVQLRSLGYNVMVLDPGNLTGIMDNVMRVGKATNHEAEAIALVADMEQRIEAVTSQLTDIEYRPKVYNEVWSDPYTSVGKGTFIDSLIKMAGGQNIFENATSPYPIVDAEAIISQNPDIIIFPSSMGIAMSFDDVADRDGWGSIPAVVNQKMYLINGDMINQPGPRQVDALEILAQIIHPEIFGEYTQP